MSDSSWNKAERVFEGIIKNNGRDILDAINEVMQASADFNKSIQEFVEKASQEKISIDDFPAIFSLVGFVRDKQTQSSVSMVGNPVAMVGNWKSALRILRKELGDAGLMQMVGEVLDGKDGGKEIEKADEGRTSTSNVIDFPSGRTLH